MGGSLERGVRSQESGVRRNVSISKLPTPNSELGFALFFADREEVKTDALWEEAQAP